MCSFLNVPLLDINSTYPIVTHHSFVPLTTKCSYSEEVEDTEHHCASIGNDLDAIIN